LFTVLSLLVWLSAQVPSGLTWDVPLACPDAARFHALVDAYLGRAMAEGEAPFDVHVAVLPAAAGAFSLQIELEGPTPTEIRRHRLAGPDCDALVRQAAALTAINIDPFARSLGRDELDEAIIVLAGSIPPDPTLEHVHVQVASPSTPTAMPASRDHAAAPRESGEFGPLLVDDDRRASPPERARDRSRATHGYAAAAAAANLALFDGAAPGFHGQWGIEVGLWRAELHGGGAFGWFRSAGEPELGGQLWAWSLGPRGCVVPRWGRVSLRGCVGAGAGQIHARGFGVEDPRRIAKPWIWLAPEIGVGVQLGELAALFVDLGPSLSLLRPSFRIDDPTVSFVLPAVAAHGRIGIELRFPRRGA
jgi:hypothetical protein